MCMDVAGYSRLMERDEEETLSRLTAIRHDLVDPSIAAHDGRIVKTTGDGLLVEFASPVEAVRCAVAIQGLLIERGGPIERRIVFRIGIHLGDIIAVEDDLFGDAVNIAARLEAFAEPGSICISGQIYDHVRDKVPAAFEDAGEQTLKNIARPIRVWRIRCGPAGSADGQVPITSGRAIAVLPFANMSGDTGQEYFADGITEDIITALSLWRVFPVIARNSTFLYKGRTGIDVPQAGRELNARYVLEGSVRRSGERVRVTGELVETSSGHQIWAGRFERDTKDIFAAQEELAAAIVGVIEPEIFRNEQTRVLKTAPESLDAWDMWLRGCWHVYKLTRRDNEDASRLFHRATELDPGWAEPHAWIGHALFYAALQGWESSTADAFRQAHEHARRALELDAKNWRGLVVAAHCSVFLREHERAIAEAERAIELNPSAATAYHALGLAFSYSGRPQEALAPLQNAKALDPNSLSVAFVLANLSFVEYLLGNYAAAEQYARNAVERDPRNLRARHRLIAALGQLGRVADAARELEELRLHHPRLSLAQFDATYPFKSMEERTHFLDGLAKAGAVLE
jgi:adenylate cyclase